MIRFSSTRMPAGVADFLAYGLVLSAFSSALAVYYGIEWKAFYLFILAAAVLLVRYRILYLPWQLAAFLACLAAQGLFSVWLGSVNPRLFVQAWIGISVVSVVSLSICNHLENGKQTFIDLYLQVCVIVSAIGLLELAWGLFSHGSLIRLQSVFREPADFALVVTPATMLLSVQALQQKKIPYGALIVVPAVLAAQSLLAIFGLLVGLMLGLRRAMLPLFVLALLLLGAVASQSVPISHKLSSIYSVIQGNEDDYTVDASTFVMLKGVAVASVALKDTPLIGQGLGSFPNAQQKYFDRLPPSLLDLRLSAGFMSLYEINAKDGGSLLSRSATELGALGVLFMAWLVWRFRSSAWASKAVLVFFAMKALRHGHYFSPELFLFIGIYWIYGRHRNQPVSPEVHSFSGAGSQPGNTMQVNFWQVVLTTQQSSTLAALARHPDCRIKVYEIESRQPMRKELQWTESIADVKNSLFRKRIDTLREGIREIRGGGRALHLFSGIWSDRRLFILLLVALLHGRRVGLLTEPYLDIAVGYFDNVFRMKAWLWVWFRIVAYRIVGIVLGERIAPIFAISRKAVSQFRRLGFNARYIYQFGYFVPRLAADNPAVTTDNRTGLDLIFVGSMIARKGLTVLSSAIEAVPASMRLHVDLFGPGKFPNSLASDRMRYRGLIPFGQVQSRLRGYHALICPSLFEGWAVVINEALLQGVPVIVSRQTGAAAMVESNCLGLVFDADHTDDLTKKLTLLGNDAELYTVLKHNIQRFIGELAPDKAGEYMYLCLKAYRDGSPAPECLWY
ncbi:MAG: glycosyltransferase [Xanthomonadales bacterium]|nr:glycosyltransferase [Xanthomonadales bacterium]